MCRTLHAFGQSLICLVQIVLRTLMTLIIMLENIVRMLLQIIYNLVSFVLQCLSLIPICLVFFLTSKLKCIVCGGGPCPIARSGTCNCLMSLLTIYALYYYLKYHKKLDRVMARIGYTKNKTKLKLFHLANDLGNDVTEFNYDIGSEESFINLTERTAITENFNQWLNDFSAVSGPLRTNLTTGFEFLDVANFTFTETPMKHNWTTILYYLAK